MLPLLKMGTESAVCDRERTRRVAAVGSWKWKYMVGIIWFGLVWFFDLEARIN